MFEYCTYIYYDPKIKTPVYVGEGVRARPFDHFRLKTRLGYLLRKRVREGFNPKPTVIVASSKEDAQEMEILLIALIGREDKGLGSLFNLTDGGDGSYGVIPSQASIEKQQDSLNAYWAKFGSREKHSVAIKRQWQNPEIKLKRTASLKQAHAEGKYNQAYESQKKAWADPEKSTKRRKLFQTEEFKDQCGKKNRKPCTIDGVAIYPSVTDLKRALGKGVNGIKSPNFRFVDLVELGEE